MDPEMALAVGQLLAVEVPPLRGGVEERLLRQAHREEQARRKALIGSDNDKSECERHLQDLRPPRKRKAEDPVEDEKLEEGPPALQSTNASSSASLPPLTAAAIKQWAEERLEPNLHSKLLFSEVRDMIKDELKHRFTIPGMVQVIMMECGGLVSKKTNGHRVIANASRQTLGWRA